MPWNFISRHFGRIQYNWCGFSLWQIYCYCDVYDNAFYVPSQSGKSMVDNYETNLIKHVLMQQGNNMEEAAKALKIHHTTLLRNLRGLQSI